MDRNFGALKCCLHLGVSLSARRAWIEISASGRRGTASGVALRKESVDRNLKERNVRSMAVGSLSARRAWIEISKIIMLVLGLEKSLSARRAWIEISTQCRL